MAAEEFKRRLTAILSADVKGYSRLMTEDEEATIRTLKTYRVAIRDLVRKYRGRVVDSPGDNILAEHASVLDAVNCAVEIQREIAERNTELPESRRMQFRIGVNLGDIVEDGERIYGDGVNIAARMEGLAEGGGICISGTVYDQVKHKLGLEYEYQGEQEVKNILEPVRVYRVLSYPGAAAHRVVKAKKAVGKTWRKIVVAMVAFLFIGAAAVAVWYFQLRPAPQKPEVATEQTPALELPDKPSIAVLPFVNVGGDKEQEYFSDGMTDDLITDLSKVSGLFVIARNSVFIYKNKAVKVQRVAQELGIRYVLEGSVRRAGNQVRINAQLIDATTGHHLWAERYDGDMSNVFGLQDKITREIVAALAVKLTSGEQEQVARKDTENTAAYDAFLQGQAHYMRRTPDDYAKAVSYFKKAVGLDPSYGRAYGALALTYWESAHNFWTFRLGLSWVEARDRAERYLELAMENLSPLAHQVASLMLINSHRHENAIAEAQRAIALDPNDASGYLAMAYALIYSSRPIEAVEFVEKAMRLDPHYPAYHLYVLGLAHFVMDGFDVAVPLFERALKLNPEDYVPLIPLAAAYAHLGRGQEAAVTIQELQKTLPIIVTLSTFKRHPLLSYKDPADQYRLLEGLRKAGMPETPFDALRKATVK
jgi:TolB-like protein/class 3 adenylate cyclase/Flp pilus assembly protein TadD